MFSGIYTLNLTNDVMFFDKKINFFILNSSFKVNSYIIKLINVDSKYPDLSLQNAENMI